MAGFPESTFTGVLVHRRNHVYVSCVSDELAEQNIDHAAILRWLDGNWAHRTIDTAVRGMSVLNGTKPTLLNMGIDGKIIEFTFPGENVEFVDASDDGPNDLLNLRCMRHLGNHIYVAGMGRRVYRREGVGLWTAIDSGVLVPRTQRNRGVGFNAIDGLSADAIYAVGYGGEIWRYDGQVWDQQDSPTNIALTCVRCVNPKTVYAAGLVGVVLRTVDGNWESIDHGATEDDFWGMTVFQGRVYLAAYAGLFVIDGDNVVPVDMNLRRTLSTAYLDANDGVIWSVGQKDLAYSEDGATWTEVAGPN
jgi:hypothetical protein